VTGVPGALAAAWQAALAAEHQAVFGYGLLGPRLSGADQQLAVTCSDAHETLRDRTQEALARAGSTPVAPLADYPALYPVRDAAAARALAARLEDACAAAWRYLYLQAASTAGARGRQLRPLAQAALTASAVRAAQWRRATVAFPGA
jgi:hypothetical protein